MMDLDLMRRRMAARALDARVTVSLGEVIGDEIGRLVVLSDRSRRRRQEEIWARIRSLQAELDRLDRL